MRGKPFAFRELIARVCALGRRAPSTPPLMRHGELTVDRARHRASRGDHTLTLTRKEFGPMTDMRTTVDVVLGKPAPVPDELIRMGRDIRTAVDQADALINALLTLTRTEYGLTVREPVDLAAVAEEVLDSTDLSNLQRHASLQPAATTGDPLLVERLIVNLVDNAVRYNTPGGTIQVTTSTVDGKAVLTVANTGPVIAPNAVDGLLQPFRRLHDRAGDDGFGLGLAIVASISAVHGGTVTAQPQLEGGLKVTVTLPEADPESDDTTG